MSGMWEILGLIALFIIIYLLCSAGWDILFDIFFGKKK